MKITRWLKRLGTPRYACMVFDRIARHEGVCSVTSGGHHELPDLI
jgi:hypothetical protein